MLELKKTQQSLQIESSSCHFCCHWWHRLVVITTLSGTTIECKSWYHENSFRRSHYITTENITDISSKYLVVEYHPSPFIDDASTLSPRNTRGSTGEKSSTTRATIGYFLVGTTPTGETHRTSNTRHPHPTSHAIKLTGCSTVQTWWRKYSALPLEHAKYIFIILVLDVRELTGQFMQHFQVLIFFIT